MVNTMKNLNDVMDLEDIDLITSVAYRTKCIIMDAKRNGEL